jgi:hypothetical protein
LPGGLECREAAWSAVVLYRFEDGRSKYAGFTLRLDLRTFERLKIRKSTWHGLNEFRVKCRVLYRFDDARGMENGASFVLRQRTKHAWTFPI